MINNEKELLKEISKFKNLKDINHDLFDIFEAIIELNEKNFLLKVYKKFKIKAKKNYFANIILLQCLAKYLGEKKQAYEEFHTLKLDNPVEYDDIYIEAHNLLKLCDRSKEELENYISEQLEIGDNNDDEIDSEIQIFQNALEFQKVKAREIMVPRTEVLAVEIHETVSILNEYFIKSGYSKILVYKTSLDEIIGYVNAFELFKKPKNIKSILLPVEIVPESMMINDVLNSLIKKRKSIAVVVDEYGGTSGIITVEDIVEELFGEIEDEHDVLELTDERIHVNQFKFSARLEIDYLNEEYNLGFPKEDAYETLGGFIINHTENIPEKDEVLTILNYKITILSVSSSKIDEIHLEILSNQDR